VNKVKNGEKGMIERFNDDRDWFMDKRFGLFVHWGLYAVGGWHEQGMWRKHMSRENYRKYMDQFQPDEFNPDQWIDYAQEAGMEYITFTAKHCDGFCMWDTQYTNYNIMHTPYKKDVLGMLAEACHRRNFPLCVYYSVVDWHHPNYPNQGRSHEFPHPFSGDEPDLAKYIAFVRNQIREICTNYGEIHGIWWDAQRLNTPDSSINDMIRSLQPKAVINNRGFDKGDYGTPERDFNNPEHEGAVENRRFMKRTEACQAVGMLSWGYRVNEDYFSSKYLIQSIAKALAMGGNYLLNVGPKPDGTFAQEDIDILRTIGRWYQSVKVSYAGTEPVSYLLNNEDILTTREGNNLYIHLLHDPKGRAIELNPITTVPLKAILLNNGQVLTASRDQGARHWRQPLHHLRIRDIPVEAFYDRVMVIKLEFEAMLEAEQEVGRETGDKTRQEVLSEAAGKPGASSHRNPDIP